MRILVAPAAYKESLRPAQAAEAIARGARRAAEAAGVEVEIDLCPLSDGGTGFVEAMARATGAAERRSSVCGPLGVTVDAPWALRSPQAARPAGGSAIADALLDLLEAVFRASAPMGAPRPDRPVEGRVAFLEAASCAGLALVPAPRRDPEKTTSYGVGELIRDAMDARCEIIVVGLGDSATCDAGAGAASALGARFYRDASALRPAPFKATGADLATLARVELRTLDDRLRRVRVVCACDVDSPLVGPRGGARTFAPQKGASPEGVERLEAGAASFRRLCEGAGLKGDPDAPGAGAAGGLGYGLGAFCGARLCSGVELVLSACRFDERAIRADLVLTGEGRLDAQSLRGKACVEAARRARRAGRPAVALVAALGEGHEAALAPSGGPLDEAAVFANSMAPREENLRRAGELLEREAERVVRARLTAGAREKIA